jgi:hypothetical protein
MACPPPDDEADLIGTAPPRLLHAGVYMRSVRHGMPRRRVVLPLYYGGIDRNSEEAP